MRFSAEQDIHDGSAEADESFVRKEIERIRGFVGNLSMGDLRQGTWFVKLLAFSLDGYVQEVDAAYFREKYPDLPADAVVDARVRMAANYAGIEGGLSAAAYNGAVAATIGSGGAASPLTLPTGGVSFVVDMSYTTYLQLRMAYDIAVLYGVPLDIEDPDDMWKLVRIAFAIRVGETGGNATLKFTPAVVRPVLKKMFSGQRLAMVKGLPIVGKHLLQRNIIKFGIPIVGVPTAVLVNRWTTRVVGDQAKEILRKEARIREAASRLVSSTDAREELVWVLWLVMRVDGCAKDDELLLLHHVTEAMKKAGCDESLLKELRELVELDESMVWRRIDSLEGAKKALYDAAVVAAAVDGRIVSSEISALKELAVRCGVEYDSEGIEDCENSWR